MEKSQVTEWLVQCGWSRSNAKRMAESRMTDTSLTLNEWRDTFVGAICSEHRDSMHIVEHIANALGKDIPQWSDTTPAKMRAVRNYLESVVTANSTRTYLAHIKATLNMNAGKAMCNNNQLTTATRTKRTPVQNVALTEEELERIHRYIPMTDTEADIKRDFMVEAYCGARNSDARNLTEKNVHDGWLTYVSQKTKTKTSVPLHRNIVGYLKQKVSKEHSRTVIIDVIQRICRRCGITETLELFNKGKVRQCPKYKFVGSHTARRSFATQLAMRGVPLPVISTFMGHSSPDMTQRYVCIQPSDISPDVQAFFK